MLRLRFLTPNGFLCFVFLEGAVALGILLALAELVSWWGVIVLPFTVAVMVKLNDLIAGAVTPVPAPAGMRPLVEHSPMARVERRPHEHVSMGRDERRPLEHVSMAPEERRPRPSDEATTRLPGMISRERGAPIKRPWVEKAEAQQQWLRQSATRRYE